MENNIEEQFDRLVELYTSNNQDQVEKSTICDHSWYDVHPSFGDPSNPCGRRCSKCNKQEWYQ